MEAPIENRKLEVEQETLKHLNAIGKWSMFLAITGFIFLGLLLIIGIIAGTFLTAFNSGENGIGIHESLIIISIVLITVVYLFPLLFLFRFSKHTLHAIQNIDKYEFNKALRNLRAYFAYIGVLIIIILLLYIVLLVAAGSAMDFLKGLFSNI